MRGFQSSHCTLEHYKYSLQVFIVRLLYFFLIYTAYFYNSILLQVTLGVEFYNLTWLHWPPVIITIEH